MLRIFRREGARQGCGAYERDRWNNYFFYNFDLFKRQQFLFKNLTTVKNYFNLWFEFKFETFYFYLRARSLWSKLGVDFYFPWLFILFSELDHPGRVSKYNWISIISFHYSARRLRSVYVCLTMVSSPTSQKLHMLRCGISELEELPRR